MKSIVWVQSKNPSDKDIFILNGEYAEYEASEDQHEAISFIQDNNHTNWLDFFISKSFRNKLINKYQLPTNFNVYWNLKSIFFQGALSETDRYGRQLPFIVWYCKPDYCVALDMVVEAASQSGYSLEATLLERYKKAFNSIKKRLLFESIIVIVVFFTLIFVICQALFF
ncbi:MAG: hypothetical protein KBT06_00500 [Prevotellaceae bacterium]|nr:hypothetical protein [Candidatus Colivivens equi]